MDQVGRELDRKMDRPVTTAVAVQGPWPAHELAVPHENPPVLSLLGLGSLIGFSPPVGQNVTGWSFLEGQVTSGQQVERLLEAGGQGPAQPASCLEEPESSK